VKIFKYWFREPCENVVELPVGAAIISIGTQVIMHESVVCFWAIVDPNAPLEQRRFFVAMTGQELPADVEIVTHYLGTAHLFGGQIVAHVFGWPA
jgi:hypothetical protein